MKLDFRTLPGEGGVLLWPVPAEEPPGFRIVFATRVALTPRGPRFVNYGFDGISGAVAARRNLCRFVGLPFDKFTVGKQVHSAAAARVGEAAAGAGRETPGTGIPATDALVTGLAGVPLAVTTADCVPILLADPVAKVAAAIHAGWRGALAGVVENTVALMKSGFGCEPWNIRAYIGPAIGPCCYEVGGDLTARLSPADMVFVEDRGGRHYLDLRAWNADRLLATGLEKKNVAAADVCTCCHAELFFSHRGDRDCIGSNVCVIARLDG